MLAGLGALLTGPEGDPAGSITGLLEAFLPPHESGGSDPFQTAERLFTRVVSFGQRLSLVAVPAFLWFATRAFASVRTALNHIYDVSVRPTRRGFLAGLLLGKARDLVLVVVTLVLFLGSTAMSSWLSAAALRSEARLSDGVPLGWLGRFVGETVAFGFIVVLFLLLYRFGSLRRIRIRAALVATTFASVAFEIARRIFAFYVTNLFTVGRPGMDEGLVAMLLFVLWLYYSAVVFLLGGVVAETWEMRHLLHRHRVEPA